VTPNAGPLAIDLIEKTLDHDSAKRISAIVALEHSDFSNLPASVKQACKPAELVATLHLLMERNRPM
jgi:hypothetical protein